MSQQRTLEKTADVEQALKDTAAALETAENERADTVCRLGDLQRELGVMDSLEANWRGVIHRRDLLAGEITVIEPAISRDERLMARRQAYDGARQGLDAITERIGNLHSRIQEVQAVEAANREAESAIRTVSAELAAKRSELDRARTECEELSRVPCQGRGEFATCPKIQRAICAQQDLLHIEGTIATLELERHVHEGGLVQIAAGSALLCWFRSASLRKPGKRKRNGRSSRRRCASRKR